MSRRTNDAVALSSSWAEGRPQTNTAAEGWWGGRAGTAPGPRNGSPGPGLGCRLAAPQAVYAGSLRLHRHASPSGQRLSTQNPPLPVPKARVPAGGAPGASLPGCGRGVRTHGVHVSLSASSPRPPLRTPTPPDRDHPNDANRPEPPTEDSFQIRSQSEVWGLRTPIWGHSSAPKTRGNVERGTVTIRFALQLTSPRLARSSPRLRREVGPVRAARGTVSPGLADAPRDRERGPGRRPRSGQRRGQRGEVCLRGAFQSRGSTTPSSRCPS